VKPHRNTLYVEDARLLAHAAFPARQHLLRLHSPKIAARSRPGAFVHVQCDPALAMRRPMSILEADTDGGWIDILFKEVGVGSRLLASRKCGDELSLIGPIGNAFSIEPGIRLALLIGGGVGIPPIHFLATSLRRAGHAAQPMVLMGSEVPFPFELVAPTARFAGLEVENGLSLAPLEQLGIPSRLASLSGLPGCHRGFVTDLARRWLSSLAWSTRSTVKIYACGPTAMLRAVAKLAAELELPCQVALEEYMACGVGGCAGCAVRVRTPDGDAMKRVCVDGPVFDAYQVV
jgi:dihydroorotate dehydrogenase electron transfer subunit